MVSFTWPLTELVPTLNVMEIWTAAPLFVSEQVSVTLQPVSDAVQSTPPSVAPVVIVVPAMRFEALSFAATVAVSSGMLGQSVLDPLCTV
jgi:hypothetical protein